MLCASPKAINPERAYVSVREKNGPWVQRPGYAGINTVQANPARGIYPGSKNAGGDEFSVPKGMKHVSAEVRLEDATADVGDINPTGGGNAGPDIDAFCKLPKR
mgnify:CR=1 FL=1